MKVRNLFSVIGLRLFALASVGAAMMSKPEAVPARAEGETWMIHASVNMGTYLTSLEGFNGESVVFRCGKDGQAGWVEARMHQSGAENIYAVNVSLASDFEFDRIQVKFNQYEAEKYSKTYSTSGSQASHSIQYSLSASGTGADAWDGDNWKVSLLTYSIKYSFNSGEQFELEENVASNQLKKTVTVNANDTFALYYRGSWNFTYDVLTDGSKDYLSNLYGDSWVKFIEGGTYDIILKNDFDGNGILEFKRHTDPNDTFIYYVLENNTPTNDYIYAWGGSSQFGGWPGTKITEVADVEEVTGNGVLHFQGSETPKLIYKIPVTIGYPTGDTQFKLNNNNDWESEARNLVGGAAYWYTGAANAEAGAAIDFFETAESYRNAAEDHSVCKISKSDAEDLVGLYNLKAASVRAYIDSSSVYTFKRDGSEGNELVSYRVVMEQLAKIAGVALVGSSGRTLNGMSSSAFNSTSVVIIIAASISITVCLAFVMIKKSKRQ